MKRKLSVNTVFICVFAALLLFAAVLLTVQSGIFRADPVIEALPDNCYEETLRVITDKDYRPYSFYDDNGSPAGHDVELIALIANEMHMNLSLEFMPWDDAIAAVNEGRADVLMTCDYSDTFSGVDTLLKTEPVSTDEFIVYSKQDIRSTDELYLKTLAIMENGNVTAQIDRMNLGRQCVGFKDNREAMLALENGLADCAVMRYTVGEALVKELGLTDVSGTVSIGQSYMCFGIANNDAELTAGINSAIEALKLSGETERLREKWLTTFIHEYTLHELILNNIRTVIILALVATAILILFFRNEARKMKAVREKNRYIEIVENLANDFECVNYVELRDNAADEKAVLVRTSDTFKRNIPEWETERSFAKRFEIFNNTVVVPEEREHFARQTQRDTILSNLRRDGTYFVNVKAVIDGNPRYYQLRFTTVINEDRQLRALVLGVHDIDEEVRREEERREQLEVALSMAQSANRAKTTFLNSMSHDIRTPMNAIIGYTNLAETHIDNREQVRDYLGKISRSSAHLLSLINDVLDMSRIESGKMTLDEKPEKLSDIICALKDIV